jgi:hypothetical protein
MGSQVDCNKWLEGMEYEPDALLHVITLITEVQKDEVLADNAVLRSLSHMGVPQIYQLVAATFNTNLHSVFGTMVLGNFCAWMIRQ